MGSSELDSLLRLLRRRFHTNMPVFVFFCLMWLVFGNNGNKTKPDGSVTIPALHGAFPGIRLDLDLGCGLDVGLQI